MGIATYNRGSRMVSKEADNRMAPASARAEHQALKDENARLREQAARLERELARARRCLASERMGRENLRQALSTVNSNYAFAVGTLCKRVFPGDSQ
jgi:chromosome segregation ATPase